MLGHGLQFEAPLGAMRRRWAAIVLCAGGYWAFVEGPGHRSQAPVRFRAAQAVSSERRAAWARCRAQSRPCGSWDWWR